MVESYAWSAAYSRWTSSAGEYANSLEVSTVYPENVTCQAKFVLMVTADCCRLLV